MSQATSPSTGQLYGLARVCRVWGIARSTIYWQQHERARPDARRGPLGPCTDDELVAQLRRVLEASPSQAKGTARFGLGCGMAVSARHRAASCA